MKYFNTILSPSFDLIFFSFRVDYCYYPWAEITNAGWPGDTYTTEDEGKAACNGNGMCLGYWKTPIGTFGTLVPGTTTWSGVNVDVDKVWKKTTGSPQCKALFDL